jgi:hypothetical protein
MLYPMDMARSTALIKEKDGLRGQVPSRQFGIKDRVYGEYLTNLNPRENGDVQLALASSSDPRFVEFLERIKMNRYRRISVQAIAKACGIDLMEFQNWWNRQSTQAAIAKAQNGSIKVVSDLIADAQSVMDVCPRCDGLKFVAAPPDLPSDTPGYECVKDAGMGEEAKYIRTCPKCEGESKVRKPGDSHARDRVLEISGIIKKEKGSLVTLNFGGASHSSAVGDLNDAMPMTIDVESEQV